MARKVKTFIGTAGRDEGKHFLLTEMSARRAEKWARSVFAGASKGGIDISPEVMALGMGAIAMVGLRGFLTMDSPDAEPLLDEMLDCVEFVPDPAKPTAGLRRPDEEDIEEVATLIALRSEVLDLHVGFSIAAYLSNLGAAIKKSQTEAEGTPNTETSPNPSEPS